MLFIMRWFPEAGLRNMRWNYLIVGKYKLKKLKKISSGAQGLKHFPIRLRCDMKEKVFQLVQDGREGSKGWGGRENGSRPAIHLYTASA